MFRCVQVPLDGLQFGEHALPWALSIARRANSPLEVIHVHHYSGPFSAEKVVAFDRFPVAVLQERAKSYLNQIRAKLQRVVPLDVRTMLLEGTEPSAAIEERARNADVDLIVMTTHGRGAIGRAWLGSVTDRLVRETTIPVLVVHPAASPIDLTAEPVIGRILIPLDGSLLAEHILEPAIAFGKLMNARITVLRVVEPMILGGHEPFAEAGAHPDQQVLRELQSIHDRDLASARDYLAAVAGRLRGLSLDVEARTAIDDQPANAILRAAADCHADLIALSTHGRRGIARLMLGSIADKVVRGSSVAVLLLHPSSKSPS
jgi:nucleotide-binding universal stress UspA family protein